jgi:hypothetical protein
VLADDDVWLPMACDHAPSRDAIACVRDGDVSHPIVPAPPTGSAPRDRVVSVHFKEGTDPAGYVAWLAAHLKRAAGTGSVVIYGKDRRASPELFHTSQGVFDDWCCAVSAGDTCVSVIRSLVEQGRKLSS